MVHDPHLDDILQVFQELPCGVVVASTSASGEILLINREFTAITGYSPEDVPTVADWLRLAYPDPDYRATVMGNWERDVSEPGRDVVYRVRCADGRDRELLLRAGLLGRDRMVVAILDRSEALGAQRDLRASEERFRLIATTVGEVFWIHAIQPERMEYVSPAFEEVWGQPVDVLYEDPTRWSASILPEDLPAVEASWTEALAGRSERVRFAYRIRRPDGQLRWIEDEGSAIRDDDGRVLRMVGLAKDVTERKEAEQARAELQDRMRFAQKMESLGVLAGGVAHDFNNLLMGVLANADLAAMHLPPGSPARESLDDIQLAARRAADLARQMLAYGGRGRFTMEPVDLAGLVRGFAHLLESMVPRKGSLRYDLADDLPPVQGDATQLRQVVMNLVTNAADAMGEAPGSITVSVGVQDTAPDAGGGPGSGPAPPSGRACYVEVADTGPGMDAGIRSRVFDPFFSTRKTGRGLGLAVVHGIVQGHGGAIELDSEPGRGTRIRILLPAIAGEAGPTTGDLERTRPSARGEGTILVADDEEVVLRVVTRMLRFGGYDVIPARDGLEAVQRFAAHRGRIDAAILDLSMPELGGLEALRELRSLEPDLPVLISSGYDARDGPVEGDERPSGFLQKPYTAEVLFRALTRALSDDDR